jgi:hypothetical protein
VRLPIAAPAQFARFSLLCGDVDCKARKYVMVVRGEPNGAMHLREGIVYWHERG